MTRKELRITLLVSAVSVITVAVALVLIALQDTIVFFYMPSDIREAEITSDQRIRVGGLVAEGSVTRHQDGQVEFVITDIAASLSVKFDGILPDLFKEGEGIVAEGMLSPSGNFVADQVLAKHDENYMPNEVAKALKESGQWRGEGTDQ